MEYDSDFTDEFAHTSIGDMHFKHHQGSGEKIIFLHGFGGNTLVWKRLVGFLPDAFDIYLVDLMGHGESDAPDIDYTVSMQFQALREFISLQNNGDSFVFGHSYGGWVAAYYASQPYTCKGIILEDTAGIKEQFDDVAASGMAEQTNEEMFRAAMMINNNKDYVIRGILNSERGPEELSNELLSKITRPVKLIWGRDDKIVPLKYGMILNQKLPGSTMDVIDGAGHEPHYEQPEKVKDSIMGFMAKATSNPL